MTATRRHAAIADVVDYSQLMEAREAAQQFLIAMPKFTVSA